MKILLNSHRLYVLLMYFLTISSWCGAPVIPVCAQPSSNTPARTLIFNSDKSLGTLSLIPESTGSGPSNRKQRTAATAAYKRVVITVPAGQLLCLEPNQSVLTNPSLLAASSKTGLDAFLVSAIEMDPDASVKCDQLMPYVNKITSLKQLLFDRSDLTDAGLAQITNLRSLQVVSASLTGLTGSSLATLAKLPDIRALNLLGTNVTNTSLKNLANMHRLSFLNVNETHLSKPGIELIGKIKTIKELHTSFNFNIDDACMPAIASMENLEFLDLRKTSITDKGLLSLLKLHKLQILDLRETELTARGIAQLKPLHLKTLVISDHNYNPEQLKLLHEAASGVVMKSIGRDVDKSTLKLFAPVTKH